MRGFISVTNEKFMDYENALIEIEKEASLFHVLENNIDENGNPVDDDSNENNEVIEKNESGDNSNEEENIQMISSEV